MIAVESYRQAIRNNQLLTKLLIGAGVIIIALAIALSFAFPLKTTQYILYEFSQSGQTVHRVGDSKGLVSRKVYLLRQAMREYIKDKESIDALTEKQRFARVQNMSTTQVFNNFKTRTLKTYQLFANKIRKITIVLDTPFANNYSLGVHVVDFIVEDSNKDGSNKRTTYWSANIGYSFEQQKIKVDDLIHNFLGISINSYTINQRKTLNET